MEQTNRTVDRKLLLGIKHTSLHAQILALGRHWRPVWIVVDGTGVGAGLRRTTYGRRKTDDGFPLTARWQRAGPLPGGERDG